MSIEQSDVVDLFGIDNTTGAATLGISDHLDWSNEHHHLLLLQNKINAYLNYIESGELVRSCPVASGCRIEILIYAKYELSESGKSFLLNAREIVGNAGFSLGFQHLPKTS